MPSRRSPARIVSRPIAPDREGPAPRHSPPTGASGNRRLRWARAVWIVFAAIAAGVLVAATPGYALAFRGQDPLTAGVETFNGFRIFNGVASLGSAVICVILAFLLFQRKRDDSMALFVSFYLLAYGTVLAGPLEYLEPLLPGIKQFIYWIVQPIFFAAPTVWLVILFPDGRPVPAWTRWLIPISLVALLMLPFVSGSALMALNTLPAQAFWAVWLVLFGIAFWAQVYRYRKVSSPTEREQTRWVVFALALWLVLMVVQSVPYLYLQNLPPGRSLPAWTAVTGSVWFLSLAMIPVALTIAILRYRLYDIDVIINRALVYGALTAILAGLYSASISLFQRVFQAITGQKSDAAIVLTTLILASAFTPIRTRLQTAVDRRFKDARDARHRLEVFAEELRRGMWVVSPPHALRRLLREAMTAFEAEGGAVYLQGRGRDRRVDDGGGWTGPPAVSVPVAAGQRVYGRLVLGRRTNDASYTSDDLLVLTRTASAVAAAFPVARRTPRK